MLETFVEAEENYNSYQRPFILDSIRHVLKFYGLDRGYQVYFRDKNESVKLIGANSSDTEKDTRYTDGVFRNKVYIKAEVTRSEFNSGFGNSRRMQTELSVWSDKKPTNPLMIIPSFEGRDVNVGVTVHFNSETDAENFVNRISRLTANQGTMQQFSAIGHLVINASIIEFLKTIHAMETAGNPATPVLEEWFAKGCNRPITKVTNVVGNHGRMAVPWRSDAVAIYFTEPETALARKAEVFGRYEVTLNYRFYFNTLMGWDLFYPLMVYQEQIPEQYIPAIQEQHSRPFNDSVNPEMSFGISIAWPNRVNQDPFYIKMPAHDPWAWKRSHWVQPIVQARCKLVEAPEQPIGGSIFELPDYIWNESVKAYMLRRRAVVYGKHDSPFIVQVFADDLQLNPKLLSMDETGTTHVNGVMDLSKTYRVVVGLDWAIRDYSDDLWDDLWHNPEDKKLIENIFWFYDFNQFDSDWLNHLDEIRADIDKGYGKYGHYINTYNSSMGLEVFNIIQGVK